MTQMTLEGKPLKFRCNLVLVTSGQMDEIEESIEGQNCMILPDKKYKTMEVL